MKDERLKEAAENAYYAWMGGTMNDVREAMKELGNALEEKRQYFIILCKDDKGLQTISEGKVYDDYDTCKADAQKLGCNTQTAFFIAKIDELTVVL